jgi:hypothetical protein
MVIPSGIAPEHPQESGPTLLLRLVALGTPPGAARHAAVGNSARRHRTGYWSTCAKSRSKPGYPKWSVVRGVRYALPSAPPRVQPLVLRAIARTAADGRERERSSRRCQTRRQPRRHGRAAQDPAEEGEGRRRARGGGRRRRKRAGLEQIQVVVPELGRRAALGHGPAPLAMDAAEGAGEPATPRFLTSSPPGAPPCTDPPPTTTARGRGRP